MKAVKFFTSLLLITILTLETVIHALELNIVPGQGGGCTSATPDPNFNQTWFKNAPMKYFVGGNKYQLYALIWGYPRFEELLESEFYYYSCTMGTLDFAANSAIIYAFGGVPVANCSDFEFPSPGVLQFKASQLPINYETLEVVKYITLTDNESYIFQHNCITNWNLKSWMVYSTVPELSLGTMQKIQLHALSLGHAWEDMVFVRYDLCNL